MVSGLEERFLKEPPLLRSWSVPASILRTEGGTVQAYLGMAGTKFHSKGVASLIKALLRSQLCLDLQLNLDKKMLWWNYKIFKRHVQYVRT